MMDTLLYTRRREATNSGRRDGLIMSVLLHPVTAQAARDMDETAAWAVSNVVSLPRPAQHPGRADNATIESTRRALQAAQAMHRAARLENDVGRFATGLQYVSVYFQAIREFVTLGFSFTPEERGYEQQTICETIEIIEVWMRGVDIGALTTDHTDALMTAMEKAIKQEAKL